MYKLEDNPVLKSHQTEILELFFTSPVGNKFFLTGGTALAAFYLAHRKSEDLDFFTLEKFNRQLLEKTIENIVQKSQSRVENLKKQNIKIAASMSFTSRISSQM